MMETETIIYMELKLQLQTKLRGDINIWVKRR